MTAVKEPGTREGIGEGSGVSTAVFYGKEDGVLEFLPAQGWEGLHGPTVCDTEPAIRAARAQGQALLTGALSLPFLSLEPEGPGREAWGLAGWVRACYPQADGCH